MDYNYQNVLSQMETANAMKSLAQVFTKMYDFKASGQQHVRMHELMDGVSGSTFYSMACVDNLVEQGYLKEIKLKEEPYSDNRVFEILKER